MNIYFLALYGLKATELSQWKVPMIKESSLKLDCEYWKTSTSDMQCTADTKTRSYKKQSSEGLLQLLVKQKVGTEIARSRTGQKRFLAGVMLSDPSVFSCTFSSTEYMYTPGQWMGRCLVRKQLLESLWAHGHLLVRSCMSADFCWDGWKQLPFRMEV